MLNLNAERILSDIFQIVKMRLIKNESSRQKLLSVTANAVVSFETEHRYEADPESALKAEGLAQSDIKSVF